MNKLIVQKVNMFINVSDVLKSNPTAAETAPILTSLSTTFDGMLTQIGTRMGPLLVPTEGIAVDKKAAKLGLCIQLSTACGAMRGYAMAQSDNTLYAEVDFSQSALYKKRDEELIELAGRLIAKLKSLIIQLAPYGVTAQTESDLDAALSAFKAEKPKVRDKKVLNKTSRELLAAETQKANDFLRFQLDNAVRNLKLLLPEFYLLYFNARRNYIVSIRHRTAPETPEARDATSLPGQDLPIEKLRKLVTEYSDQQEQVAAAANQENGVLAH